MEKKDVNNCWIWKRTKRSIYLWFIRSFKDEINKSESWPNDENVLEYIFLIEIAEKFHVLNLRVEKHFCVKKSKLKCAKSKLIHVTINCGETCVLWEGFCAKLADRNAANKNEIYVK